MLLYLIYFNLFLSRLDLFPVLIYRQYIRAVDVPLHEREQISDRERFLLTIEVRNIERKR